MKCPTCGIEQPKYSKLLRFEHRDKNNEPCEGNGINNKNEKYKKTASLEKKRFIRQVKHHIENGLNDREISETMGEENICIRTVGLIRHGRLWKNI